MRIRTLNLEAYGPFEGEILTFETSSRGFHIVYGPNEAGKSSALRAIEALLFGIETKTDDNFRHEYKKLRISAELEGSENLFVRRRKGREKTLLDAADRDIDPAILDRMLGGASRELFRDLWGLSYATLRAGAQDLLQQQGNLTNALFQSGGLVHLNALLKDLEAEAKKLYRPQGSSVFKALSETHKLARLRMNGASVSGSQYDRVRKGEEVERQNRDAKELDFQQIQAELGRLERLKNAAPTVGQYLAASQRLSDLGRLPQLPGDSRSRRTECELQISIAASQAEAAEARAERERTAIDRLEVDDAVLERQNEVRDLVLAAARVREALGKVDAEHRPVFELKTEEVRRAIATYGLGVSLDRIENDLPDQRTRSRLRALGAAYDKALGDLSSRSEAVDASRREVSWWEEEWEGLPAEVPLEGLVAAIESARALGDIEDRLTRLRAENQRNRRQLDDRLAAMSPGVGGWDALARASIPNEAAVASSKRRFESVAGELREAESELRREQEDLLRAKSELRQLESSGRVLQREDVESARRDRDELFGELRQHWQSASEAEIGLYQTKVESSDRIADELGRDAERVSRATQLREKIESSEERIALLVDRQGLVVSEAEAADREWKALWRPASVVPLGHEAMERWRLERATLLADHQSLGRSESEAADLDRRVREACAALDAVSETGDSLSIRLNHAMKTAERLASQKQRREEIAKLLRQERVRLRDAEAALKTAQATRDLAEGAWRNAASAFGSDATWAEVGEALDGLGLIDAAVQARSAASAAIEAARAQAEEFERSAKLLGDALGETERDPALLAARLDARLRTAQASSAERTQRQERLVLETQEAEGHRKAEERGRAEIAALLLVAGASDLADLERIERLCELRDQYAETKRTAEETLAAFVGGGDLDRFVREVDSEDRDSLPARISVQEARAEAAREGANRAREDWKEANMKLQAIAGADDAADAAADMESAAAGMATTFERYASVRAAYHVIRAVADRYREENQGPILQKAGERLATLTGSDFSDLVARVGDSDQVELFAVRSDGSQVSIPGMSEGTRDSLFLALRLASLEERIARTPPLPLILDDVLIHLDDRRTGFALRALADFADSAQVILFTHHRHIVELAQSVIPDRFQQVEMRVSTPAR
ncbi:YhaN family protein [Fimbriimonas ginsengisoli]|uniref:SMC domain protein n=1 Tax=Fimbriimonas ginsengisoli Gsoil 348 TaxID=661478 RepID=A0A068NPQ3_FIMGI|nr:YhaN family protein [Fimbriimonas ginsengisoli]AIE85426.1 SMC domain protein [Fimbriimonas ginsengisoli Gsoil 348]